MGDNLVTKYPGGCKNIRSIFINCGSNSLPLYASIRSTNDVGFVSGKKTKSRGVVTGELSTVVGAEVTVTPFGNVRVKRKADPNWTEDDETLEKLPKDSDKVDDDDAEDVDKKESEVKEDVKEKKSKKKKEVQKKDDDDSEDDMEDQELEYMKKVAEEEEEMERKLEENEDKLGQTLKKDYKDAENSEEDEEEADPNWTEDDETLE